MTLNEASIDASSVWPLVTDRIVDFGNGFWSIRGHFRLGGILDVGTQAALIRLETGRFVVLDSYETTGAAYNQLMALTDGGKAVEAVLNLHPFHTLHCAAAARMFPAAKLYGLARHKRVCPDLAWEQQTIDQQSVWATYEGILEFSVPSGIDLVTKNERAHFGSVLACHRASGTVHVDDTFVAGILPRPFSWLTGGPRLRFHPTLGSALRNEPGAAQSFRKWARDLADKWQDTRQVCAAHRTVLPLGKGEFREQVLAALDSVEKTLAKQENSSG